jgi:hypothetical protein
MMAEAPSRLNHRVTPLGQQGLAKLAASCMYVLLLSLHFLFSTSRPIDDIFNICLSLFQGNNL